MAASTSRFDPLKDIPDLSGRVAIVTGANAGIGLYTAYYLAKRGAKVYLGARSEEKAKAAVTRLRAEGLGEDEGELIWLDIDLSDPRRAKKAAQWFMGQEVRLDILASSDSCYSTHSLGRTIAPYARTADDISDSMVTNHISPYLFTKTLLPLLRSTALQPDSDVRIVNLTSVLHHWAKNPSYDSLEAFNQDFGSSANAEFSLYGYTKLANILWTSKLQRLFDKEETPIVTVAVHPGKVMSEGNVRTLMRLPLGRAWVWAASQLFLTSAEGAYTSIFAAALPLVRERRDEYKGRYMVPFGRLETPSSHAQSNALADELWQTTEQVIADFGFDS
ncbi:NAD-P-binding protein [Obba rivulosa]|uniref:NAD-P-binding protein n=1 Tax=Obba rivulosa TaxID=1052685 RepID=A0A8E2DRK6_9APHY|nr:NAD-P-binding protein [Obba rivulosa]